MATKKRSGTAAKLGRPRKYESERALAREVTRYFLSISRTEVLRDERGRPILNDAGEEMTVTRYAVPPSVSGLCLHLGIDRKTWLNYCDNAKHPEFTDVTAMTRARLEAYLEQELLAREKSVQGVIFNLQNNYGWKQQREMELGDRAAKAVTAASVPLSERKAMLDALLREFAGGEADERADEA